MPRPAPARRPWEALRAGPPRAVPPLPDPEKLAALLYTSGTSGRPRAAMLTHRALIANLRQVAAVEPPMIHGDDVVLAVLPLFHVYGLNAVLGGALWHRAKLVLAERFDPQGTLDLIDDEACSVVPLAPPVFAHWRDVDDLAERLGPVRLVLSGSAPLEAEAATAFTRATGLALHQGYGLTEAAPVVTSTLCSAEAKPGSVGAALPGVELPPGRRPRPRPRAGRPRARSRSAARTCSAATGPTAPTGRTPTAGGRPATSASSTRAVTCSWSTGSSELVIVSGFNVFPVEVEAVLAEVDGVEDVAVIGVPDEMTGEAVVAYVRAPGARAGRRRRGGGRARRAPPGRLQAPAPRGGRRRPAASP